MSQFPLLVRTVPLPIVRVGSFTGPLDELLSLVQQRRLAISEVALAEVADEYLARMREKSVESLEEMVLVLWIVASLLACKARALIAPGEEREGGSELAERLALLQDVREWGRALMGQWGQGAVVGVAASHAAEKRTFALTPHVAQVLGKTADQLISRCQQRFAAHVAPRLPVARPRPWLPLRSVIQRIRRTLRGSIPWRMRLEGRSREEVVVLFLAVLELVRRGEVEVEEHPEGIELTLYPMTGERYDSNKTSGW